MAEKKKPGSQVVPRRSVAANLKENLIAPKIQQATARKGELEQSLAGYDEQLAPLREEMRRSLAVERGEGGVAFDPSKDSAPKDYQQQIQKQISELENKRSRGQSELSTIQSKLADESKFLGGTEREVYKGAQFADALLGDEGLGRLGEDAEVQDVLQRYKDISEQGLGRAEVEQQRAQAFEGIDRNTQTAQRQLMAQLARAGVKGSVAGRQLLANQAAGMQQKAGVERDLFLQSEQMMRQGLQDYSQRLGDVKTFDLAQAAKEKDLALQTGLSFAQIKNAKDIARVQAKAAEAAAAAQRAQAAAQACFAYHTKVRLVDGSFKEIGRVCLGEELSTGRVIGISQYRVSEDQLVNWKGNVLTGSHIVYDTKKFKLAKEVGVRLKGRPGKEITVYDILVQDSNLIELENSCLATDQEAMAWSAEAIADFLNEGLKADADQLTERV